MGNWKYIAIILSLVLALSACGRKEAPQLTQSDGKPALTNLQSQVVSGTLTLNFELHGDAAGVGYQIDRTEMDPYCQCPGFWRRYFEQPARSTLVDSNVEKLIRLRNATTEYLYRIRAVDQFGNLGPWSPAIHARGVDLSK